MIIADWLSGDQMILWFCTFNQPQDIGLHFCSRFEWGMIYYTRYDISYTSSFSLCSITFPRRMFIAGWHDALDGRSQVLWPYCKRTRRHHASQKLYIHWPVRWKAKGVHQASQRFHICSQEECKRTIRRKIYNRLISSNDSVSNSGRALCDVVDEVPRGICSGKYPAEWMHVCEMMSTWSP